MSMTIQPSSAPKLSYFPSQPRSSLSFMNILKVLAVAGAFFQTGMVPAVASDVEKLPEYCTTRCDWDKLGMGMSANNACYGNNIKQLETHFKSSVGINRLISEYYLGRSLACPYRPMGPSETGQEQDITKILRREQLQGLAHMYHSGCLKVIYPEKGQTIEDCYSHCILTSYSDVMHYSIDGCYYFVTGALICPDPETFEDFKVRFLKTV